MLLFIVITLKINAFFLLVYKNINCNPMEFRDHSERIYYLEGKEINVDFRIKKHITNV